MKAGCKAILSTAAATLLSACASMNPSGLSLDDQLEKALSEAETNATADDFSQFLIARYASLINDPDEAARKYALVARSRPDDQSIAERAVFSALLANDFPLALSISTRTSEAVVDESSLPRLSLAADAMARGDFLKVPMLTEGTDPGLFNGLILTSLKAWALFGQGKIADAEMTLLNASSGDPYLSEIVLNMLGLMETASKDDDAARKTFDQLNENETLIAVAADAYARLLLDVGETEKALSVLDSYGEDAGHNPVITELARRIRAGERPKITRLNAREGAALSVYVPAAALAAQSGNDLPTVYYSVALRLDPDLSSARALLSDALDRSGRSEEAIAMLKTIPKSSPYHIAAIGQLAWALHRAGDNDAALDLVYQTLSEDPPRDLKIQMADLMRSLGHDGEALTILGEIIDADQRNDATDWRLYYARGAIRERLGKWPLAEQDLVRARMLNPDSPDVLNHLGYGWIDRGVKLEEGLDLIRKALSLRPDSGAITDSLGWAHYKLGEYDEAIVYLERAAELQPGLSEISNHLGDAYWMAGRRTEARYQWERAISLLDKPANAQSDAIRRKMLTGPEGLAAMQSP